MLIEIVIPALPKMLNQILRMGWRERKCHNDRWQTMIRVAVLSKYQGPPLRSARLTLIRHGVSPPDYDGLVGSFKAVIDSLVGARLLYNDDPSVIGRPIYEFVKCKRGDEKIIIKIER